MNGDFGKRHSSARRVSIGQVMMVVALAALNLALGRAAPLEITMYPSIWVVLGCIDFVIVSKLILSWPFRAFHYTFLIVFPISYFVMAVQADMERIHPLGVLVRWYQQLAGEKSRIMSVGYLHIGEIWMTSLLGFAIGCALGWIARWFERHRNWDIAAFWRGALVGFGVFCLLGTIDDAMLKGAPPHSARLIGRSVVLGVCVILGGLIGLFKLKSTPPIGEAHGPAEP